MFSNFKKLAAVVVFFIAAAAVLGYLNQAEKKKASSGGRGKGSANAELMVRTTPVMRDTVETIIEINGRLFSELESTVSAEVDGVVEFTTKEMGDTIGEKEMLVKI